jgi:hypothetical protein
MDGAAKNAMLSAEVKNEFSTHFNIQHSSFSIAQSKSKSLVGLVIGS